MSAERVKGARPLFPPEFDSSLTLEIINLGRSTFMVARDSGKTGAEQAARL